MIPTLNHIYGCLEHQNIIFKTSNLNLYSTFHGIKMSHRSPEASLNSIFRQTRLPSKCANVIPLDNAPSRRLYFTPSQRIILKPSPPPRPQFFLQSDLAWWLPSISAFGNAMPEWLIRPATSSDIMNFSDIPSGAKQVTTESLDGASISSFLLTCAPGDENDDDESDFVKRWKQRMRKTNDLWWRWNDRRS